MHPRRLRTICVGPERARASGGTLRTKASLSEPDTGLLFFFFPLLILVVTLSTGEAQRLQGRVPSTLQFSLFCWFPFFCLLLVLEQEAGKDHFLGRRPEAGSELRKARALTKLSQARAQQGLNPHPQMEREKGRSLHCPVRPVAGGSQAPTAQALVT